MIEDYLPEELKDRVSMPSEGCWEWQDCKNHAGYGQIRVDWKAYLVHRYVYLKTVGEIPPGMLVRHICDNPSCCRPSHLRLGTHQDNMNDAKIRGRMNKGTANRAAKFSDIDIHTIRQLYTDGKSQSEIARLYGVNRSCIWKIVHLKHWKHL